MSRSILGFRFAILFALCVGPTEVASAQDARGLKALPAKPEAPVAPGDQVRVIVFRKAELSGDFIVAPDGSISHPVFRDLHVVGLGPAAVDSAVGARLRAVEGNSPYVVEVLHRVTVGGRVRTPGFYFVRADATIAHALTMAGGVVDPADLKGVQVTRDGRRTVVDLRGTDPELTRFNVRSGDEIVVQPRRTFRSYLIPTANVVTLIVSITNLVLRVSR